MNRPLFLTVSLLILSILFSPFLLPKAQAKIKSQPKTVSSPKHVFETKMDLGLFGLLGGGMNYYLDGQKITHYRDFKKIIYPLRDEEASKLIRDAEEADVVAWILFSLGVSVGADVALAFKPVPLLGVDWMDRIATGFVATQAFVGLDFIFETNAQGLKYNAVQRYNHLVSGGETASLDVTPQIFADRGHLGLGLNCRF